MQDPKRILVVEDDPLIRSILGDAFEAEGLEVVEARDRASVIKAVSETSIDLVTMDLALGSEDGLELVRQLKHTKDVPIVMISGRGSSVDRILGLEVGADDYIVKPFNIHEVVLRINKLLDRHARVEGGLRPLLEMQEGMRFIFDGWIFDAVRRELRGSDGNCLHLTEKECRLLLMLVTSAGRVVSRDEMSRSLNGHDWSPGDRSIDSYMVRLRKMLDLNGGATSAIKSVRSIGYVFASDVRRT